MIVTKEMIHTFIHTRAREMEKYVRENICSEFDLGKIRIKTKQTRSGRIQSWGGVRNNKTFISIGAWYFCNRSESTVIDFNEYRHIKDRHDIGTVKNVSWMRYFTILLCHEIAHAVEYHPSNYKNEKNEIVAMKSYQNFYDSNTKGVRGHGRLWQFIYSELRKEFYNNGKFLAMNMDETVPVKKVPTRKNNMSLKVHKVRGVSLYVTANNLYFVGAIFHNRVYTSSNGLIRLVKVMTVDLNKFDRVEYVKDGREGRALIHKFYRSNS